MVVLITTLDECSHGRNPSTFHLRKRLQQLRFVSCGELARHWEWNVAAKTAGLQTSDWISNCIQLGKEVGHVNILMLIIP